MQIEGWVRLSLNPKTQNISLFLSEEVKREYSRSTVQAEPCQGSAKFPPFTQRERNEANPNEAPKNILTQQEAAEFKEVLLGQFEEFDKWVVTEFMRRLTFIPPPGARHSRYSACASCVCGLQNTTNSSESIYAQLSGPSLLHRLGMHSLCLQTSQPHNQE